MKTFSFTLIVYILILLTQPCQDIFAQDNGKSADSSETHYVGHPAEDIPPSDDCSPFCICACRQVPSAYQNFTSVMIVDIATVIPVVPTFEYRNPSTKNFHNSIWQPPKA